MKNEKAYLKKMMYNELDEAQTFIKGKVKPKINKPKAKDSKPIKGRRNISEDWD